MKSWRASLSAILTRKGPPEKVGKAVKLGFPGRFCRAKRKADSINSDIVRPCRAASCLTLAIKRSSILRVVFAFVLVAPCLERAIEVLDRLLRHCLVLHGMTEVEPSLDARQQHVRAGRSVCV